MSCVCMLGFSASSTKSISMTLVYFIGPQMYKGVYHSIQSNSVTWQNAPHGAYQLIYFDFEFHIPSLFSLKLNVCLGYKPYHFKNVCHMFLGWTLLFQKCAPYCPYYTALYIIYKLYNMYLQYILQLICTCPSEIKILFYTLNISSSYGVSYIEVGDIREFFMTKIEKE